MPGITKGGLSHGERNRDQKGRKPRQPTLLFLYLRCVTLGTGETDGSCRGRGEKSDCPIRRIQPV